MRTFVLISEKYWHLNLFESLQNNVVGEWYYIDNQSSFTKEKLDELKPDIIFIPHWSYIIPEKIYSIYKCIVFHMTDLPFGRGGSPLQNLIERGYENTVISAIKVEQGIDTGDIYLKTPLSLLGTAEEIFIRASKVIENMIIEIIQESTTPYKQDGEIEFFNRRKPEDGNILNLNSIEEVYNFIRMLDCEGYPNAFLEVRNFRLEFSRASLKANKSIIADVRIVKK